jgi:hypothetical protein
MAENDLREPTKNFFKRFSVADRLLAVFLAAWFVMVILPVIPIFKDALNGREVTLDALLVTAALYPIALGTTSKSAVNCVVATVASIAFIFVYGIEKEIVDPLKQDMVRQAAQVIIWSFASWHTFERFVRHFLLGEEWLEFE